MNPPPANWADYILAGMLGAGLLASIGYAIYFMTTWDTEEE